MKTTQSQTQAILDYMLLGCKLTGLEALKLFGVSYLPARINDLRNNFNIVADRQRIKTESGKYVNEYWIETKIKIKYGKINRLPK